jgi:hypothetical protein
MQNAKLEASSMGDVYELCPVSLYRFCVTVEDVVQIPSPATFAPSEMSRVRLGGEGGVFVQHVEMFLRTHVRMVARDAQPIETRNIL